MIYIKLFSPMVSKLSTVVCLFITIAYIICYSNNETYLNITLFQAHDSNQVHLEQQKSSRRNYPLAKSSTKPMCREMFSVTQADNKHPKDRRINEVISIIKKNMKQGIGGVTEPYSMLADMLPSLLEMNYLNITEDTPGVFNKEDSNLEALTALIDKIIARYGNNPPTELLPQSDIIVIRSYMVAKQRKHSYRLRHKNLLEQLSGEVPFIPCRVKSSFTKPEIVKCLQKSREEKDSLYNIAFLGDSKLRGLFCALAIETKYLNYTLDVRVSVKCQ